MEFALLDSSVYVSVARGYTSGEEVDRLTSGLTLWLSAVVLQELYAGATGKNRDFVKALERSFFESELLLVPQLSDWISAGKMLAMVSAKYGYEAVGRSRLGNDALIAASAARVGIKVVTANGRDFSRLAEFCNLAWQLVAR
jgi:predicted nucleic acid-binding protein